MINEKVTIGTSRICEMIEVASERREWGVYWATFGTGAGILSQDTHSLGARMFRFASVLAAVLGTLSGAASAAEIKLLTAGAFEQVVKDLTPGFERQSGHKVTIERGTAGELKARIERGDGFDVAVITPVVLEALAKAGKVGVRTDVATVGVGVGIKEGAPRPDISTVDAFKRALLGAKAVAYIDPASGGTSG